MIPPESPAERRAHLWGRRDALTALGWTAIAGSLFAGLGAFGRLLFRRAPVEAPTRFRAGHLEDYGPGAVSDRFLKARRVFIVREGDRVFAVYGRCTHLGCTPRWYDRDHKFKCPCHGSGFDHAGVNFEGPAPKPLERAQIWLDDAGDLWVDVGSRYARANWDLPGASVLVHSATPPGKESA